MYPAWRVWRISVVTVMVASQTSPPLTTIRQDVARGAALMVDLLFDRSAGTPAASARITPQFVRRASA